MDNILKIAFSVRIIESLIIAAIACGLVVLISKLFKKYLNEKYGKQHAKTPVRTFAYLLKAVIIAFAVLLILQINGINVTSAVAGLGIASAIVGLALQDILKDVIMGVHIVADKYFQIGDVVKYNNFTGVVIEFNSRTTSIKDLDNGNVFSVSNRNISEIVKITGTFDIDVPLGYGENKSNVDGVLQDINLKIEKIDGVKKSLYLSSASFGDNGIFYKFRITAVPEKFLNAKREANGVILQELANNNLAIPYNTVTLNNQK